MSITSLFEAKQSQVQKRIGPIISVGKEIMDYRKKNPNIDETTDAGFLQLKEKERTLKNVLINLSPTAREKFANPDLLPDSAPYATAQINLCLMQDIEKGLHEPKIDVAELQNIASPIMVKVQAIDKKGNPLESSFEMENGETITVPVLEDVQVFAFKGTTLEEVATNLGKLISLASQQASEQVQEVREELETMTQDNTGNINTEEVKRIIDAELAVRTNSLSKSEILAVLNSPEATKIQNDKNARAHYITLFDEYMEELKNLHFELKEDGNWYPRQGDKFAETLVTQVNYNLLDASTNKVNQTQGTAWDALTEYSFKELQQNFANYNNNNKDILLQNVAGRNNELNKQFINILTNSTDLALRRLSTENPNIPTQAFYGDLPTNKYQPQIKEESYLERLANSGSSLNLGSNIRATAQNIAYGQSRQQAIPQPQQAPYLGYNTPITAETPTYSNYDALPNSGSQSGLDNIPIVNSQPVTQTPLNQMDLSGLEIAPL